MNRYEFTINFITRDQQAQSLIPFLVSIEAPSAEEARRYAWDRIHEEQKRLLKRSDVVLTCDFRTQLERGI